MILNNESYDWRKKYVLLWFKITVHELYVEMVI